MKLRVLDQIHISSVSADSLRKDQLIAVSKALGEELLKKHPTVFEEAGEAEEPPADEAAPAEAKAAAEPENKAEPEPPNKAAPPARKKAAPKGKV